MDLLAVILENSLKRLDLADKLKEYGIWPIWNDTVGPTIARNAQPEKIRHGTLFVKVSGPTWMQQLQYMKGLIAEKLNQRLEKEVVKNIFFVVGQIKADESKANEAPTPNPSEPQSNLDEDELRSIRDPEIRRSLKRLYAAQLRNR
jgi:hypothetical protein